MLIYTNYIYQVYIIGDFEAYPEPVAAKLRRALFYTNIDVQPKNALKYYRQAIELADEMGLDPFSDEMLGVKIQVATFYEKLHEYQKAIDVLELVREDCLKWMEKLGGKEGNEGKRTRVLGKTIAISVKLGEHYANQYIDEKDAAEEKLVWAVTALLKEQRRREDEGVKEGEGQWMSNEEIGGTLEGRCGRDGNHHCSLTSRTSAGPPLRIQRSAFPRRSPLPPSSRPLPTNQLPLRRANEQPRRLPRAAEASAQLLSESTSRLISRSSLRCSTVGSKILGARVFDKATGPDGGM